jgi:16S rRNA (uracil1498-N3)-methyltransferase
MHRVRVAVGAPEGTTITLTASQAHYVSRVLRLRVDDVIAVFDGSGREWQVQLTHVEPAAVQGRVVACTEDTRVPAQTVILGQGLPKHGKMDLIVEKCSELGLDTLVPLYTERTVVRERVERQAARLSRWQRVAEAAARQSGRRTLLDIQSPQSLQDFCEAYSTAPARIVCWEDEQTCGARHVIESVRRGGPCVVLVGPEGGLTAQEVTCARRYGFTPMSLGPRILRTETAAIVVTALLRYRLGDLDPTVSQG